MRLPHGVLSLAVLCHAGQFGVIPSDAAHMSPDEARSFLHMICPGDETTAGCSVCPPEMPPSAQTWELRTVTFGHFLAPKSEDALVSGFGCEPHVNLMSGSYLFTKQRASRRKVWYSAGEDADDCKKLPGSDGRDRLVCEGSDMHQGVADWFLYTMDPGQDPQKQENGPLEVFFDVNDTLGSCQTLPEGAMTSSRIESVSFVPVPTHHATRIIVLARLGKAVVPEDAMASCQPGSKNRLDIATVPRRYRFVFDGRKVTPTPGNPPTEYNVAVAPATSWHKKN
jgi:hypothetical protein